MDVTSLTVVSRESVIKRGLFWFPGTIMSFFLCAITIPVPDVETSESY